MPYGSNDELPENVKNVLPDAAQTVYREAYNSADEAGNDEDSCHAIAWTAVKNGWNPPEEEGGKWTRKETFIRQLALETDFKWSDDDRIITLLHPGITARFQKFQWLPGWTLPDWATGRLFYFTTLSLDRTLNQVEFSTKEKIRCAASLVGVPLNLNHEIYGMDGMNVVLDSEEEDNRIEGLCYVESKKLLYLYDSGDIVGCSIEYTDRSGAKEDWGFTAAGVTCWGLAWVTKDHICGDPTSRIWEATTHDPNVRDVKWRKETVSDVARAKEHFELTDEEWDALSEDEKKEKIEQLPSIETKVEVIFCPDIRANTISKRLQYTEASAEDRVEWIEADIQSLYNQLWTLEQRVFDRFDAMDQRINDIVAISSQTMTLEDFAATQIYEPHDDDFAWIERGGALDDGGRTIPRELRHFQMMDENGYNEEMLRASMHDLLEMYTDGDIANECFEATRHRLIEGFKSLGLDIPEEAREPDKLELARERVDVRHQAFLMRHWRRQQTFRSRFDPLRRGDDEGARNRPPSTPYQHAESVKRRAKKEK